MCQSDDEVNVGESQRLYRNLVWDLGLPAIAVRYLNAGDNAGPALRCPTPSGVGAAGRDHMG